MNEKTSAPAKRGPATELAVAHMPTLKPEHQQLLATLLADPGMASATLEVLVEHLFDEEDPRLVAALHRARAGVPVEVIVGARPGGRASVGDLRVSSYVSAGEPSGRGTVGNLRRR